MTEGCSPLEQEDAEAGGVRRRRILRRTQEIDELMGRCLGEEGCRGVVVHRVAGAMDGRVLAPSGFNHARMTSSQGQTLTPKQ
jgi:hypothetical protein